MRTITTAAIALLVLLGMAGTATALPGDTSASAEPGPPGGLPDVVPDFVSDILGLVGDFVTGLLDGILGDAVSEVAGGGG